MDQEVLDARAKLAARFGTVQVGGKGKQLLLKMPRNSRHFGGCGDSLTAFGFLF
jgi:hypothetical protein